MAYKDHKSSYQPHKKSIILRIVIIVIAAFMFLGAILVPFMYSGIF